jgi:hypothetical protein
VKQTKQGTFVHQAKYTKDLMKKLNMAELNLVSTPMSSTTSLGPDKDGESMDQREYRSMIGSHRLPPVPHNDMAGHSVHRGVVHALSGFPTLFTSDGSSANF